MTRRRGLVVLVMLLVLCGLLMHCTEADLVLRTLPVGGYPVALAVDQQTSRVFIVNRATRTVADSVSVLDARRGAVVQVVRTDPGQSDAVAVNERTGRAFIVTADANGANGNGTVRVLDTRSDAVLRVIPLNVTTMPAVPVPVVVDERTNRVFVANGAGTCCWAGTVSILDATSGRLLHSVTVGVAPSAVAVDERRGRVYVPVIDGVSILDARTGTVLRAVPFTGTPGPVTVDERTGRVFVGRGDGTVHGSDLWGWMPPELGRWVPLLLAPRPQTVPGSVTMLEITNR